MPYVWTFILILCVLTEAASAALTAIWFMPAGLVCLVMSLFDIPIAVQVITFAALGALMLIMAKTVFKKYIKSSDKTPTNADRILGQTAVVTAGIVNDAAVGEIRVGGQYWSARSSDGKPIAEDEKVTVLRIEGVKAIVERQK